MKKIFLLLAFLGFVLTAFSQSKLNQLEQYLKDIDKTWKLAIDTATKESNNLSIGRLNFKKGKQEISFCVYTSSKDNNEYSIIKQFQKIASCNSIGSEDKNRIGTYNGLFIFLSVYPCWSTYKEDAKKMIDKIFSKLIIKHHSI